MELSYHGSGAVELQGKKRECHLYLNDEDGGILLEIEVKEALPSTLELPDQITELKVELSNGAKFVLNTTSELKTLLETQKCAQAQ